MIPVVMSGGSGTRLWPVSRSKVPKQFCDLFQEPLQTQSLKRSLKMGSPFILTSLILKDHTEKNIKKMKNQGVDVSPLQPLYEPEARNTAAAVAYLCAELYKRHLQDDVVGLFPSDHLILNEKEFLKISAQAEEQAALGYVVTLGIQPHFPSTGYGYIQTEKKNSDTAKKALPVKKFHEKPDAASAEAYLKDGSYFWNSGIYFFKASTMMSLFKKHTPKIAQGIDEILNGKTSLAEIYSHLPKISLDVAISEKLSSEELVCIPSDFGWSDVGSWDSLAEIETLASPNHTQIQAQGNYVHGLPKKNYSFAGVDDLIVVDTPDALMVTKKGSSQLVKDVVADLQKKSLSIVDFHQNEERPWGSFEVLKDTEKFKSKVVYVEPGGQLSYQSHEHREEHWLFIAGTGEVVLNDEIIPVSKGQYVKIPLKAKHRIRNTGSETVIFVEVQLGTYFGEDDIKRYQDDYQRT